MTDHSTEGMTRSEVLEERRYLRPDSWASRSSHNDEDPQCIHAGRNSHAGGWCQECRGAGRG
jgi:hypothetical protein